MLNMAPLVHYLFEILLESHTLCLMKIGYVGLVWRLGDKWRSKWLCLLFDVFSLLQCVGVVVNATQVLHSGQATAARSACSLTVRYRGAGAACRVNTGAIRAGILRAAAVTGVRAGHSSIIYRHYRYRNQPQPRLTGHWALALDSRVARVKPSAK